MSQMNDAELTGVRGGEMGASAVWQEEFLQWIGCSRDSTIEQLIVAQLRRWYYCNVNIWDQGRLPVAERVPMVVNDGAVLWERLRRTGFGFCFELIEVQLGLLQWLGHKVTRHAALPLNVPTDQVDEEALADIETRPWPHEVLLLADGGLVDVGYSANALTSVLRCRDNEEAVCGDNRYRVLTTRGGDWKQLEVLLAGGWTALYRYRLAPSDEVQHMVAGMICSPQRVRIRDEYVYVAKAEPGLRRWLHVTCGGEGKAKGGVWRRVVNGIPEEERWEDAKQLVRDEFGGELDERLKPLFV